VQFGTTTVYTGTVTPTLTTGMSSVAFRGAIDLTCTAVGGATNALIYGNGEMLGAGMATPLVFAAAVGSGFDSTASGFIDFFATWNTASASNIVQLAAGGYELISSN